jgi:ribonuclease Z
MTVRDLTILGCSSQQPTRYRNHGAYLLRWNNEGFLFDPGEGTQRQFIFADIAPTCVTRIFVSHFHGDHCLGLGSMLMRLNLDHVEHEIHCYYPASGKVFFDRLRYGTAYHDHIKVIEHPVSQNGFVEERNGFRIEAYFLDHGIDNIAWRIKEADVRKFDPHKLHAYGIRGPLVKKLIEEREIDFHGRHVRLDDVSELKKGDTFAIITDTRPCKGAKEAAEHASLLVCESTYLEEHRELAWKHYHMTAAQAATLAKEAGAKELVLTHFSARYPDVHVFEDEARHIFARTQSAEDFKRFEFKKSY